MSRSSLCPAAGAALLLAALLGPAGAGPRGLPYLPPEPGAPGLPPATADPALATETGPDPDPLPQPEPTAADDANETDPLLNRFGGGQDDVIHFDPDLEERPLVARERQVAQAVSRGVAQLALRLDRALSAAAPGQGGRAAADPADRPPDNVLFSPLSVAVALALLLLGSGGRTHQEISEVLGLTALQAEEQAEANEVHQEFGRLLQALGRRANATDAASEALSAQGVFVQKNLPLRQRFLQVAQQAYSSDVMALDFAREAEQAQRFINGWVSEKTRGRITDVMAEPPPRHTRLVLATALYFNGQWQHPFPLETTRRRTFFVTEHPGGETLDIDMMANNADLPHGDSAALGCQILGLPYKGGDVVMYLVLPHRRGAAALKELEAQLTVDALEELVASAQPQDTIAVIPRMRLVFGASLREPLQQLGVRALFDPLSANLSRLATGPETRFNDVSGHGESAATGCTHGPAPAFAPLYVDEVLHKVEVEVTETGTVASAATVVSVTRDSSHRIFRADRPFLFFIRHQPTGLVLFWGSVVRPTPA